MANSIFASLVAAVTRRRFLSAAAGAAVFARADAEPAPAPLMVEAGRAQRPKTDVEAWNVGLITACRPGLTFAENHARDQRLWADICRSPFGRLWSEATTSRIAALATQGRSTFGRISSSAIRTTAAT